MDAIPKFIVQNARLNKFYNIVIQILFILY
jgi:hypothetical protein